MTRIIAGAAKGRRLTVPPTGTRPTGDRAREALFSALQAAFGAWAGVRVLDLYAGSGALGLEALSRGAAHALLVERDRAALTALRANVELLGLPGALVRASDVTALAGTAATDPYDLLLADPPYDLPGAEVAAVLRGLAEHGWLAEGATVVVERGRRDGVAWPVGFRAGRERRYGDTVLHEALWYGRGADPP